MAGIPLDVDDPAALYRFSAAVQERFPSLNVLFANAGISRHEDIAADSWTIAAVEAVVATNILGTLRVAAALLPMLKGRPDAMIMATTSNLTFIPRSDFPTYCASKALPALLA